VGAGRGLRGGLFDRIDAEEEVDWWKWFMKGKIEGKMAMKRV